MVLENSSEAKLKFMTKKSKNLKTWSGGHTTAHPLAKQKLKKVKFGFNQYFSAKTHLDVQMES